MSSKSQPINSTLHSVAGAGADEADPLLETKSSLYGDDVTVAHAGGSSSTKFGLGKASFNIITIVMGAGVLNLPKAVAETGWLGVLFLVLMGVLSAYTSVILAKCMYEGKMEGEPDFPTYTDVGERAFGAFGKWFVSFQVRELVPFVFPFSTLQNSNSTNLFPSFPFTFSFSSSFFFRD